MHESGGAGRASDRSAPEARQRRHRAAVALRLLAQAPDAVPALDWDEIDRAPAWLTLPDAELVTLQCRIGAVLCAPALRLWIDGPRLAAGRAAVGAPFLQALLALPAASTPIELTPRPRIDVAAQVDTMLRLAGASVLLASMPSGPLRRAAGAALAPAVAATMAQELARSLIARAQALVAGSAGDATSTESGEDT